MELIKDQAFNVKGGLIEDENQTTLLTFNKTGYASMIGISPTKEFKQVASIDDIGPF